MKPRTFLILGVSVVMLSATAFAAPAASSAPLAQTGGGGDPVSGPIDQIETAAAVAAYWTPERMAAAIPMDMEITGSPSGTAPAIGSIQTTGTPGMVPGNAPGEAPGSAVLPQLGGDISPATAVWPIYSYPFPYNTSYIAWLWSTWYPYLLNGKLFFSQNGGNYLCSGTSMTSGSGGTNRLLLTAGHCTHDGSGINAYPHWSYNVLFCPGWSNGPGPYGCWTGIRPWVLYSWFAGKDLRYDEGIMETANTNSVGAYGRLGATIGVQGFAWNQGYQQHYWEFGYPVQSPFDGTTQILVSASAAVVDDPGYGAAPWTVGTGSNMTPGSSGGGWIMGARIGASGYLNGLNSYKYITPPQPLAMYGPYFETSVSNLWNAARVSDP